MFHQFITPTTTKLSFTNASDLQGSTSPVSTISFYSNTSTIDNTQRPLPASDSWKPPAYFDYPTPPNPYLERIPLSFGHAQDTFRLADTSVPVHIPDHISTTHDPQVLSIKSPEYCPKTPVYVTKPCDNSQKVINESPIFYPPSPTNVSNVLDFSIDSPEYSPVNLHQISNNSSEINSPSSPISILITNELKRSTLSERKGNSIEQSTSVEKKKFNKFHSDDDEQEDKENSVREPLKLNIPSNSVDEGTSTYIEIVNSDLDITTDTNQTPTISEPSTPNSSNSSNLPNDPLSRWKRGLVRRSTRLAAKPPLNYRV